METVEPVSNIQVFTTKRGHQICLLGTAHVCKESRAEVLQAVEKYKPHFVLLELCRYRTQILLPANENEAFNSSLTYSSFKSILSQHGSAGLFLLGLQWAISSVSSSLNLPVGEEMRAAIEAVHLQNIRHYQQSLPDSELPLCVCVLVDRPLPSTIHRAYRRLSWWNFFKLLYQLLAMTFSSHEITEEEINQLKNDEDALSDALQLLAKEAPILADVIVKERDLYLTQAIKIMANYEIYHRLLRKESLFTCHPKMPNFAFLCSRVPFANEQPADSSDENLRILCVLGKGHVRGIMNHWDDPSLPSLEDLEVIPLNFGERHPILKSSAYYSIGFLGIYFVIRKLWR